MAAVGSSLTSHAEAAPIRRSSREHHMKRPRTNFMRKCWDDQQMIELSKIVHNFKNNHERLPDTTDREFWAWCCVQFNGRFTCGQLRSKVLRLKFRHAQLSSGRAKTIKLGEREMFKIWTVIMVDTTFASPPNIPATPPNIPTTPPSCPYTSSTIPPQPYALPTFPQAVPCTSSLSNAGDIPDPPMPEDHGHVASAAQTPPMSTDQIHAHHGENKPDDHGHATSAAQNPPSSTDQVHAHHGENKQGEKEVGGVARAEEEHQSTSDCSAVNDRTGQQDSKFQQNLMYQTTVAGLVSTTKDLAAATRMLAKIVSNNGPPK